MIIAISLIIVRFAVSNINQFPSITYQELEPFQTENKTTNAMQNHCAIDITFILGQNSNATILMSRKIADPTNLTNSKSQLTDQNIHQYSIKTTRGNNNL